MAYELGSSPIDFELMGVDDKTHKLEDYNDKEYLAIIFSCNHCPYVVVSEREFIQLQNDFGQEGFQIVAINTNSANPNYPGDSFDKMKLRSAEKSFNFPYLDDSTQEISRRYGAGRTPEVYLYNKERKLIYHGRINDNPRELAKITRHDLREALNELLDGKEISISKTPTLGCSIKFVD